MKIHIKIKHGDTFLHKDVYGNCVIYKAVSGKYTACVNYRGFYENYIRATLTGELKNTVLVAAKGVIKIL